MRAILAEWADSQQPLQLTDVPADLLDAGLHLADARLKEKLFAPRLPVYELPWLPRQPPQQLDDRAGCEGYAANHVGELVDGHARADIKRWWVKLQKDLECIEKLGPACDRSDKLGTLAIAHRHGQDQFHRCARGYFWDCRASP